MTTVLGFDVSSTTLAWALLSVDIKLLDYGYIKPIKSTNMIEKLADTRNKVKQVIEKTKPDLIVIEDIIQFMAGGSSAKTIITLAAFNRMVGLTAYDYNEKLPQMISVLSVRNTLKKQAGLDKNPQKEEIPEILEQFIGRKFPWEFGKKGKVKVENFDVSDAIAVAYTAIIKGNNK